MEIFRDFTQNDHEILEHRMGQLVRNIRDPGDAAVAFARTIAYARYQIMCKSLIAWGEYTPLAIMCVLGILLMLSRTMEIAPYASYDNCLAWLWIYWYYFHYGNPYIHDPRLDFNILDNFYLQSL